ncbi:MAG: hypothetical protein ACXQT4_07005 [Methanotrichaceae archaeon]
MLVLVSATSAQPEEVQLGQYNLSFDLNSEMDYTIVVEDLNTSLDGINFVTHLCWLKGDKIMLIALTDYQLPIEVNTQLIRKGVIDYLNSAKCKEIETYVVTIDQKPGSWGWGKRPSGSDLLCAIYWPDRHEVNGTYLGQVDCVIVSDGAPKDVTENLLNTIHVEKDQKVHAIALTNKMVDNAK